MKISLKVIAKLLDGNLIGDSEYMISGVSSLKFANNTEISFIDSNKYLKRAQNSQAGAVIVKEGYTKNFKNNIVVPNPRISFSKLISFFNPKKRKKPNFSKSSFIHKSALIDSSVYIGHFVCIGDKSKVGFNSVIHSCVVIGSNVVIGDNVIIFANVTIMENCIIGNNVIINSGTVIGSNGFGYAIGDRGYYRVPHIGIVKIDNDVEIGSCNTIDRATIGKTWIKSGVKTDNMVHIAHNVLIGQNTLIVSNVAIAGSSMIGENVIIAGKAGIGGHIVIGDNVKIGPKSGVVKDVPDGEIISGSPAFSHKLWLRVQRNIPKIPDIFKRVKILEKKIEKLQKT